MNPLFKDTVTVTELKGPGGNKLLGDLHGQEALRILHRDKAIKVVVTEEFFLSLLSTWHSETTSNPANTSNDEMKRIAREEIAKAMKKLGTDELGTKNRSKHG